MEPPAVMTTPISMTAISVLMEDAKYVKAVFGFLKLGLKLIFSLAIHLQKCHRELLSD